MSAVERNVRLSIINLRLLNLFSLTVLRYLITLFIHFCNYTTKTECYGELIAEETLKAVNSASTITVTLTQLYSKI